jgi:hypothetical protein
VTELIIKGPPRPQYRARRIGLTAALYIGLLLVGVALGVTGLRHLSQGVQMPRRSKSKYRGPSKLGGSDLKEPLDAREAAVFANDP